MMVKGNLTVTKTQHLECEVTAVDILQLVRAQVHIPSGVPVRIFVEVPGGGDWSHTDLDIAEHPVQVRAEWSIEEVTPSDWLTPPG